MKIAWKATVAFASLLLASCGGGGGNAALSKTFNYGAMTAPSPAEQTAATSAQGTVSSTSSFGTSPDATKATSIVGLADDMAASALGSTPIAMGGFTQDPALSRAMRTAAITDCTTVSSTQTSATVTFTNCSEVASGVTINLNGTVTATHDTVTWDIQGSFSGTNQGVTVNVNLTQSGKLTVNATTVIGDATSSISGSASGNGQSVSLRLDTAASVNLNYANDCVTSGTIEVKRVWAQRPTGATAADLPDAAVKLTWTGCNTVQVQHPL